MRLVLVAALAALACTGCGGTAGDVAGGEDATLLLDSAPGAVHSGVFLAKARGYDEAEGVTLRIRRPSASTDVAKRLEAGRADLAILDIHDLGLARERGDDLVGVMAIVQRPLYAVIAKAGVARPRSLEGRSVRVAGRPWDDAVLRSVVAGDGGDPAQVRTTTGGRFDAETGRWDLRPGAKAFHVDDYGAPSFPELVLCATRDTIGERAPVVRAAIRALQRGYQQAQADPESAVGAVLDANRALSRDELSAQLDAVSPAFTAGAEGIGQLRPPILRAWAAWDRRFGILARPLDVSRAFDLSLVGRPPTAD